MAYEGSKREDTPAQLPRILVLGDPAGEARYHPIEPIQEALGALEGEADITVMTNYTTLADVDVPFANIDLIINCIDNWQHLDDWHRQRLAARLLIWTAGGGAILTVHNGVITHETPELLQFHGADFTRHDQKAELRFEAADDAADLLKADFTGYSEVDEPYEYTFSAWFEQAFTVWLYYHYQGEKRPAGWHRRYGEGHMLYLMPGHDAVACRNPNYRILLRNGINWLLSHKDDQTV